MARKPRIEYEGAFYHVITRGNRKELSVPEIMITLFPEILEHLKEGLRGSNS